MADFESPWGRPEPDAAAKPPVKSPAQSLRARNARTLAVYLIVALLGSALIWALMQSFPGRISAGDDWSGVIYRLGFLALVIASLLTYRLSLGRVLRYAACWAAVAGVLVLGYSYRSELADAALRIRAELIPGYAVSSGPHEMVLAEGEDGAYSVIGRVDGQPVRFIIDTGASDIVLTPDAARSLGVDPATLQFRRGFGTANGMGEGAAFTAGSLDVGGFHAEHVPMTINRTPMQASLLGMPFLRRLQAFEMRGGHMILHWR